MASIEGLEKLAAKLREMAARATREGDPVVAVGYTAAYALYVHENLEMKWKGLPRGSGFDREGGVVIVPRKVLNSGTATWKARGYYWDPQGRGQSKFLEQPLREHREVLARIVIEMLSKGKTMAQALLVAGLRLQRESQMLVPIDTGNLRASAFTRLEFGEAGPSGEE